MKIIHNIINVSVDYFSPLKKQTKNWTKQDKIKFVSFWTFVIPLVIGSIVLLNYVAKTIQNRVRNQLSGQPAASSKKVAQVANSSISNGYVAAPETLSVKNQKKHDQVLASVFLAKDGLSQHSPKYQEEQTIVGYKTNHNGTKEPVYFASASCTPLAIAFALTVREIDSYVCENTPSEHLDTFLGNKIRVGRGILELQKMIINPHSEVTIDHMNVGGEDGLRIYNAMVEKEIVALRTFRGDQDSYFYFDSVTNNTEMGNGIDWYKDVLKNLKKGEGALVIFGGYSIGIRRIEDVYEIFDSHNSNSYTNQSGACIIHCPNVNEFEKSLDKIRASGAAVVGNSGQNEARGIDIFVF